MDYLIGALLRRDGEEAFHAFVAHGIDREGEMFREFVEWWSAPEDPVIYHWHAYERRAIGRMAERHGLDGRTRDRILRSLVDLHRLTTRAFVFPTYGNSIKQIAPFMGYEWQHDDVSATESIGMYFEYVSGEGEAGLLQKIVDYNRDDCVALRVVRDWVEGRE